MGAFSLLTPRKFVAAVNYSRHVQPSRVNTREALHQGLVSHQLHPHDHAVRMGCIVFPLDLFGTLHENLRQGKNSDSQRLLLSSHDSFST